MTSHSYQVKLAEDDAEIKKCYAVAAQLRPHFLTAEDFFRQVKKQMEVCNFRLVYLEAEGEVKAVGGVRLGEWLVGGKYLEIEDLVTKDGERSKNYGGRLFDWISDYAQRADCQQIKLVSGVKRFGAHKFYLNKGMIIQAHFFSLNF